MNINETIAYFEEDLKRTNNKLSLYREIQPIFEGLDFDGLAKGINMWVSWMDSVETYWIEFNVGHAEGAEKNLQPFIHALCKHFNTEFKKEKNWNESALNYIASFEALGHKVKIQICDIVPQSCHIEETVEHLTDEEIEEKRRAALADIQTTRIIRKIVCE